MFVHQGMLLSRSGHPPYRPENSILVTCHPPKPAQLSTHGHPRPELDSTKGKKHGIKDYKIALIFLVHFPDADSRFG